MCKLSSVDIICSREALYHGGFEEGADWVYRYEQKVGGGAFMVGRFSSGGGGGFIGPIEPCGLCLQEGGSISPCYPLL